MTEERQFSSSDFPGYVGFGNLPNQVHRKFVKKGFEFTLMVVGESGLGKSTLVSSLFQSELYPDRKILGAAEKATQSVIIERKTVDIEERGVRLKLTIVDTPGFSDTIDAENTFQPLIKYIDDQYNKYLEDESGLNRRNLSDNRVHCCFYFINPSSHGLKPLDAAFMKAVHQKVNIVPIIAKSDTLTKFETSRLKKRILENIASEGIEIYPIPEGEVDEDESYKEQCRQIKNAVPFAVVGSNQFIDVKGKKVRGRAYPWGVIEVENPEHSDFIKLRSMLITHMQDLQERTHEIHYENFRSEMLSGSGAGARIVGRPRDANRMSVDVKKLTEREDALKQKEMELERMQRQIAEMQKAMAASQKSSHDPNVTKEVHDV